ncbi:hypothetical protein BDQ17DRAFT_1422821 [Cyathus striatus]|nr:hypothetical protein BDQ17DRAFT_1422821 [Cyathus striatus]
MATTELTPRGKTQLDVFHSYKAALNDLTPAQRVLNLPDTLDVIFSHVSALSKSGRDALYVATLTSTTFYNVAQLRLWRRPRDLDTVEQQVRFAFGVAISAAYGESLGEYVKRLRIRWQKGSWNTRLIKTIVSSCPGIKELTIHWGDAEDGMDSVTQESIQALYEILGSLPNLTHLYLFKFCATEVNEDLQIPDDAYVPFSNLEELQLYDFHWYWKPINEGLSPNLNSLDIGFGTLLKGAQLSELSSKTTGLKTLRLSCSVEIQDIRSFTSALPDLECIDITQFNDLGMFFPNRFANQIFLAVEEIMIKIVKGGEDNGVKALVDFVNKKHQTLKNLYISFEGDFKVAPKEEIVTALSSCSQLEKIFIDFDETKSQISDAVVEKLLEKCPNLVLTDGLETLVKGREFYEQKYRVKLRKKETVRRKRLKMTCLVIS